jgi:hypothetical protein
VKFVPRDVSIAAALAVLVALFSGEPAKLIFASVYVGVCAYVLQSTFRR